MYTFSKNSYNKLSTCHDDLIKIFELVIKRSNVDFGISEGHRTIERQNELYRQGKSKIDGVTRKGKHNVKPSEALDVYVYHSVLETRRKIIYSREHLSYIAGLADACANELFEKGEIKHKIRWGGNWDSDGVIGLDQSFDDFPHFELIK